MCLLGKKYPRLLGRVFGDPGKASNDTPLSGLLGLDSLQDTGLPRSTPRRSEVVQIIHTIFGVITSPVHL